MSARSFRRSHAKRIGRERRRLSNAKRRAVVAGATLGATVVFAANAEAATYTVTNAADSGPGSLRDAINSANTSGVAGTPDTITFAPNLSGPIDLTSGQLNITDPGGLNIDGPGAGAITVSGAGQAGQGIFAINVADGAAVSISGLTLTQGSSSSAGGAINDRSSPLTLTDDTISGNTSSASIGGGIYADHDLTISGSTISGNSVTSGAGGGIGFSGQGPQADSLSISNSMISGNSAGGSGPFDGGGGVFSTEPVSISDSQITGNQATSASGGGLMAFAGSLSLTGSTVSGNAANDGGGVFTKYATTIDHTTISQNTATYGGGLGIQNSFESSAPTPVVVQDSTISGNQAPKGGGVDVESNKPDSPITITASTLSGNHGGTSSFGGGILITGELYSPFELVDSTITGNTATDGGGVSLSYTGSTTPLLGTDSTTGSSGSISFDNSTIDGNAADTNGGGIYLAAYAAGPLNPSGTAALHSTIVANDTANGAPNDLYQGNTTTGGVSDTFSLIQNPGNAVLKGSQLITGVDPQLNPLGDNGGPTQTMLPKDTSPVIDQGQAQQGLTTDQRGQPRTVDNGKTKPPGGDGTDIGAVELAKIPAPSPPPPPPPNTASISATVGPASGITDTRATLNGSINTSGQAVTWHFEWGRTTGYGKVTSTQSISAGHGQVPVSFNLSGLKPGTRYHYRVVAVSASGQTATSGDATFKTPAPTIKVRPGAVRAAHAIRLFGSAGACTRGSRVTLISGAFSPAHKFHTHNAIHARVGAGHRYSVVTRIPAGRKPGRYAVTARCDGARFGVTAFLRVLPPPPVARFTA